MKSTFKVWMGVAAVALAVAILAPAAQAQCPQARVFGGNGGGMFEWKINILTNGTENAGNEIGYFWENGNASNDNTGGGGVGCPSSDWWILAGPDRRIAGSIATPTCQMDACPPDGGSVNWVVEDATGDGSDAGMIMIQVDETPGTARWYDHARLHPDYFPPDGATSGGTASVTMERYPTVNVTSSAGAPPGTTVTNSYLNLALNYHGRTDGTTNTNRAASDGIEAYQILGHHGGTAPTRARGSWNLGVVHEVLYADAAVAGDNIAVPCPDATGNVWLGVGVEFVDGVESALVGAATAVSCDPNIADPDDKKNKFRPKNRRKKPLGRTGR